MGNSIKLDNLLLGQGDGHKFRLDFIVSQEASAQFLDKVALSFGGEQFQIAGHTLNLHVPHAVLVAVATRVAAKEEANRKDDVETNPPADKPGLAAEEVTQ